MNEVSLAWMAGVFEGEGHISISRQWEKNKGYMKYWLRVNLTNTDRSLIKPFREISAGSLGEVPAGERSHRIWRWGLTGKRAGELLSQMLPYMRGRKGEQARAALEFLGHAQHIQTGGVDKYEELAWREACKQHISELGRGEPVSS